MSSNAVTLKLPADTSGDLEVPNGSHAVAERAQRLRDAVQKAGGNRAVAAKTGMPLGTLNNYIAGRDMKAAAMIALADACEVSLDWLAKGTGPMKPGQPEAGRASETRPATLFGTLDMTRMTNAVHLAQMSFAQNGKVQEPRNFAQMICLIYDMLGKETDDQMGLLAEILEAINARIAGIR